MDDLWRVHLLFFYKSESIVKSPQRGFVHHELDVLNITYHGVLDIFVETLEIIAFW